MPTQLRVLSDPLTPCVCVRARVHAKQVTRLATLATCYYAQFGDSTLQAPALSRHRYQIPLYFHHPPPNKLHAHQAIAHHFFPSQLLETTSLYSTL